MKRRLQARAPHRQQALRTIDSPYLTSHEALQYLRLRTLSALYSHMRDNRLPYQRVGRSLRFDTRELDAWMRGFNSQIELVRAGKHSSSHSRAAGGR